MNSKIRELQNNLVDLLNSNDLPIEIKRIVLINILDKVTEAANNEISLELAKMQEETEKEESNAENI